MLVRLLVSARDVCPLSLSLSDWRPAIFFVVFFSFSRQSSLPFIYIRVTSGDARNVCTSLLVCTFLLFLAIHGLYLDRGEHRAV